MTRASTSSNPPPLKAPTGIAGFDRVTAGGLPLKISIIADTWSPDVAQAYAA